MENMRIDKDVLSHITNIAAAGAGKVEGKQT